MYGVMVCCGSGCSYSKSEKIIEEFQSQCKNLGIEEKVIILKTDCLGFCEYGPTVVIEPGDSFYSSFKLENVNRVVTEHLVNGSPVEELLCHDEYVTEAITSQVREMFVDPYIVKKEKIEKYKESGAINDIKKIVDNNCGKCTACRIGTMRLYEGLNRIIDGQADESDLEKMEGLCNIVRNSSLCGTGKTTPEPILETLAFFRGETDVLNLKKIAYKIDEDKCIGCTLCARVCNKGAVSGKLKEKHTIDEDKCTACGDCVAKCKFKAIWR